MHKRKRWCQPFVAVLVAAAAASAALMPQTSPAQEFLGSLFRFFGAVSPDRPPASSGRTETYGYGDASPMPLTPQRDADPTIHATYCVRLCDGRFFPLSGPSAGSQASAARMCAAMCPASRTAIFRGGRIDDATAMNGERYADLANAFVYRDRLVAGCTCNGKDAFGLARIDIAADPTLRAGDVVATADGLKVFNGFRSGSRRNAEFTPVDAARMSADTRRRLTNVRVRTTQ